MVVAHLENQFYPMVVEGLSKQLRQHGYHLLLFCTEAREADDVLAEILQYQVDGIVLASTTLSSALARSCAQAGVPVLQLNRTEADSTASSVAADNVDGGRQVGRLLCRAGHQRIAYVAGFADTSTSRDREIGLAAGLAEFDQRCVASAVGDYSFEGARRAVLELCSGPDRPDALFVANDHMAIAAMDTLRIELGLRVPDDISVVGFDDVPQAAWGAYRLTTVRQQASALIESTVSLLLRQIETGNAERHDIVLPVSLVLRDSARLPPPEAG